MNIEVRGKDIEIGPDYRAYVARKIDAALARFGARVASVRVGVADVNGPRGGIDKTCRITVRGAGAWLVVVTAAAANPYAVVQKASDRLGRAVRRAIARSRERAPARAV